MVAARRSMESPWWVRIAIVTSFHEETHKSTIPVLDALKSSHLLTRVDPIRPLFESRNDSEEHLTLAACGMVNERPPKALGVVRIELELASLDTLYSAMERRGMTGWQHKSRGLVACIVFYCHSQLQKQMSHTQHYSPPSHLPMVLARRSQKREHSPVGSTVCTVGLVGVNSNARAVLLRGARTLEDAGLLIDDVLCTIETAVRDIPDGTHINGIHAKMRCASNAAQAVAVFMFLRDTEDTINKTISRVYVVPGPLPSQWIVPIDPVDLALPGGIMGIGMVVTSVDTCTPMYK